MDECAAFLLRNSETNGQESSDLLARSSIALLKSPDGLHAAVALNRQILLGPIARSPLRSQPLSKTDWWKWIHGAHNS
jgi:hypothetical protein